jgi:hypothetical protein
MPDGQLDMSRNALASGFWASKLANPESLSKPLSRLLLPLMTLRHEKQSLVG